MPDEKPQNQEPDNLNKDSALTNNQVNTPSQKQTANNENDKKGRGWVIKKWQSSHTGNLINSVIALGGIITAIYAISTFRLTQKSIESNNIKDSILVDLAIRSFNSSNDNFKKSNNELKAIADASTNSATYSNGMLEEVKNEYKIENEPNLQFDAVIKDLGTLAVLYIKIYNSGKAPVYLIDIRWSYFIERSINDSPSFKQLAYFESAHPIRTTITGNSDYGNILPDTITEKKGYLNAKKYRTYMGGYIKYRNEKTKEINKYAFMLVFYSFRGKNYILQSQRYNGND